MGPRDESQNDESFEDYIPNSDLEPVSLLNLSRANRDSALILFDDGDPISLHKMSKELAKISTPLMIISITDIMVDIIANALIANLNNRDSSAINFIASTRTLTMFTFGGAILVTGNFISEEKSRGNLTEVGAIYRQSLLAANLLSIPPIILLLFIKDILISLEVDPEIASSCKEFFEYFILSVPANLMLLAAQQALLGLKKPALIFCFNLPALGAFYLIGNSLSKLKGVKGIAITYLIRSWSLLIIYNLYFFINRQMKEHGFFILSNLRSEMWRFIEIIKIGLPVVLDNLGEVGSYYMLTLETAWLGEKALVAQNVSSQYIILSITPSLVFSKSAGVLIAEALGQRNYIDIRRYGYLHLVVSVSLMIGIAAIVLPFTRQITNFFTPEDKQDSELYNTMLVVLIINSLGEVFDSIHNVLTGCLRSLRDTAYPAISNNLSLWAVSVPTSYLFSNTLNMGIKGIALGNCLGLAISNLPLYYRWHQKSKIENLIEEEKTVSEIIMSEDRGLMRRCIDRSFFCCKKKPASFTPSPTYQGFYQKRNENELYSAPIEDKDALMVIPKREFCRVM